MAKRKWTDLDLLKAAENSKSIADILEKLNLPRDSGSSHRSIKLRLISLGIQKFKHHSIWNKGLTSETDDRIKRQAENLSKNYKLGINKIWCEGKTKYNDDRLLKLSNKSKSTINEKIKNGTWHTSFNKRRIHEYKGIKFHGTWELKYAQYLDLNGIRWIRPTDKFDYEFEGVKRKYTPDFYLVDSNTYIEIKGYETLKDRAKWACFPGKLIIIKGKELKELGLIDSYKDIKK